MEKFNLIRRYEVRIPMQACEDLEAMEAAGTIPDTCQSDLFHAIIEEAAAGDLDTLYLCKSPTYGNGTWLTYNYGANEVETKQEEGDERYKILYKLEEYGCSEKGTEVTT
jgi:hypothetical protein